MSNDPFSEGSNAARDRISGWLDWLPQSEAAHPAKLLPLVFLTVGGVLIIIGSVLPWFQSSIPIIETIDGIDTVTATAHTSELGVERTSGLVVLAFGFVFIAFATAVWRFGLKDLLGIIAPAIAGIPLAIALLEIDRVSDDVATLESVGIGLPIQIDASIGVGMYVAPIGVVLGLIGAVRIFLASYRLPRRLAEQAQRDSAQSGGPGPTPIAAARRPECKPSVRGR